jgi:hypothetical protein
MKSQKMLNRAKLAIFLLLALAFSGCAQVSDVGGAQASKVKPTPAPPINPLSGRIGESNEVLAVKVDDTKPARPQIGLLDADVIYIEQVEGGATRLAAIYSSKYPQQIGPIRSARISDMELLAQYGRVAFAYSGSQRKLRPVIDSANLFNLGAEREGLSVYSRAKDRRAPYNMILDPFALFERAQKREFVIERAKSVGWKFRAKTKLGEEVISAEMKWPGARYEIVWSDELSGWLINQSGTSKVDASGVPLVASTFVIQVVAITDSEYGDKFGGVTPLVTTVGQGRAFVFRDGRVIPGTWNRPDELSGTTFTSDSGSEIPFKAGQIWVALVAQDPEITYPAPVPSADVSGGASPSPTK